MVNPPSSSSSTSASTGANRDSRPSAANQTDEQFADFDKDQFSKVSKAFQDKEKAIGKLVQDVCCHHVVLVSTSLFTHVVPPALIHTLQLQTISNAMYV